MRKTTLLSSVLHKDNYTCNNNIKVCLRGGTHGGWKFSLFFVQYIFSLAILSNFSSIYLIAVVKSENADSNSALSVHDFGQIIFFEKFKPCRSRVQFILSLILFSELVISHFPLSRDIKNLQKIERQAYVTPQVAIIVGGKLGK